jgi:CBS domain-containing protein
MYGRTSDVVRATDSVRATMRWPVTTVEAGVSLTEVAETLAADEVGALLVDENGVLAGIVSERDVVAHVAAGADLAHLTAGEVMSSDLITIEPGTTVREAATAMADAEVRHLPVLEHGEIAGIVSMRDLFAALVGPDQP